MNVPSKNQIPILELDLLKTLIAIAETGSFSAAAKLVFRTPSAISMQVKRMEELLGISIFARDSRTVTLTADGELLLLHAKRVLAMNRDIVSQFVTPEISGFVRLGAPDDAAERYLPDMLRRFSANYPGVTVDVLVENSSVLKERIKQGHLDMAMVTCAANKDGNDTTEILFSEPLVWAGLKGGIAVETNPIPISVWEENCVWRKMGIESLKNLGISYRIAFQSANISGQRAAILADLAIAPIPVSALGDEIVRLDKSHNLPQLANYAMGLLTAKDLSAPAKAAADHLRSSFA